MKRIIFVFAVIAALCGVASCDSNKETKETATETVGCAIETDTIATDSCVVVVETVTEDSVVVKD